MKVLAAACLALTPLAAGCVQYASPAYARVTVSASAPYGAPAPAPVSAGGYAPESVPDIPSVPGQRVDAETIRRALDGFGSWSQDPTYGTVWFPSYNVVGDSFVPYGTQGRWVLTDSGWYWQSDLRFGWLTFHYGRWVQVRRAWAWVPGAMFAPAWVDWRVGGGYVGWAPLPPLGATFSAPYAFCTYSMLGSASLWSRTVYGTGAASIYGMTSAVPPSYGIGGAVYAWGPTPVPVAAGGAPPTLVPVATAWRGETNPRGGSPAGAVADTSPGRPVGDPALVDHSGAAMPTVRPSIATATRGDEGLAPSGRDLRGSIPAPPTPGGMIARDPAADPTTFRRPEPIAWAPVPAAGVMPREPGIAPVPRAAPTMYVNTDVIGSGRYRTSDTVTIRSSVPTAPMRETVSLGTTGGYGGDYGGERPVPTYAPPPPSAAYAPPSYNPPPMPAAAYNVPSYQAPSYNPAPMPSGGGYNVPGYGAPSFNPGPAPSFNAPHYAAPSFTPPPPPSSTFVAPHFNTPPPAFGGGAGAGGGFVAPGFAVPPAGVGGFRGGIRR